MSTPRNSHDCRHGSTDLPANRASATRSVFPPIVSDQRVSAQPLPLDAQICALVSAAERDEAENPWAARVAGLAARSLFVRSMPRVFAFAWGWSPAQLDGLALLDVSGLCVAPVVVETSSVRHRMYRDGVRKAPKRSTAMDRVRAEAQRWGIDRKAVA